MMESIGQKLKKARLAKALSLEQAYKATKIDVATLKAIEEDKVDHISPVYLKGFLKIYCKELNLPVPAASEQGGQADASTADSAPAAGPSVSTGIPDKIARFFSRHNKVIKIAVIGIAAVVAVIVLVRIGQFVGSKIDGALRRMKQRQTAVVSARAGQPPKTLAQNKSVAAPKEKSGKKAAQPAAVNVSSVIRLTIRAREDCWMQVKVDGKVVFQNILRKSRAESWQAKERIVLSAANAGVIDLEVNGKLISNLGRRGQALKNITVTKEGLTTGQ